MTDTLTVYLSGAASEGDPNATLMINGQAVGGILDVQADDAADNSQAFTFTGNFGATPTVSISMVNQGPYNTPDPVRVLDLDGFSYDGVSQMNDKVRMNYDQTRTFQLASTAIVAERVSDFTGNLGVDAHLEYWNTSYGLPSHSGPNTSVVTASLGYLGISRLRVGLPTAQTLPEYLALMQKGCKFDIVMPATSSGALLPQQLQLLTPIASAIASIEGPNEIDLTGSFSWNGQTTLAAGGAYQQALFHAVKSSPVLAGKPVLNLTLGGVGAGGYAGLGNLTSDADFGNIHVYFPNGGAPADTLDYAQTLARASTSSDPIVITETNYPTAPGISGNVSDDVQARYMLDLFADAAKDGIASTYVYELLDEQPDASDTNIQNHYGLFNADGSPKQAATAIHNLMSVLTDVGSAASAFSTGALAFSVTGLPASGNDLVLEKSNGAYDLVVWAEPKLWDAATSSERTAAPRQVTVALGQTASEVKIFDPLTGTSAIADTMNTSSVTFTLTDHPVIVEVEPGGPTATRPVTIGSGPDTLALNLSEDAFQGDALYTITVDGRQVGGTMTEAAAHGAGQSQTVNVLGTFSPGTHVLGINFLNDFYIPGVGDRNLYLDGLSIDGNGVPNGHLALKSAGRQDVAFAGPTPSAVAPVNIGSGPDTLSLQMSEDGFQGDALYTVAVDGNRVGGTMTETASHAAGQTQTVNVAGSFGPGSHSVSIDFLNDLYTPGLGDRNLYLAGATLNGASVPGSSLALMTGGVQTAYFLGQGAAPKVKIGTGSGSLVAHVSEQAFDGDALYTVSIDGKQIGGTLTAVADHLAGATQELDIISDLSPGLHVLGLNFLNDRYEPGIGDRNFYLDGVSVGGVALPSSSLSLTSGGTRSFIFTNPATSHAVGSVSNS